jgi:hypothetical protein
MNKIKNFPTIFKHGQLRKGVQLTDKQLAYYQQEKIKKDIHFFESTGKYLSYFISGTASIIMIIFAYDLTFNANINKSIWNRFMLSWLDIEEVQDV